MVRSEIDKARDYRDSENKRMTKMTHQNTRLVIALFVLMIAAGLLAVNFFTHLSAQNELERHCAVLLEPLQAGAESSEATDLGCYDSIEEVEAILPSDAGEDSVSQVSQVREEQHCVVHLEPLQEGETASKAQELGCYPTYQEAVAVATNGRVHLPADVEPGVVTDEMLNGDASSEGETLLNAIIGQSYWTSGFGGSSITWIGDSDGCLDGDQFQHPDIHQFGWGDAIGSSRSYSGCSQFIHFEHTNYGGTSITCNMGNTCEYMGYMFRKTSSLKWRP